MVPCRHNFLFARKITKLKNGIFYEQFPGDVGGVVGSVVPSDVVMVVGSVVT